MNHPTPSWIVRLLAGAELQQSSVELERALDQAQQQATERTAAEAAHADAQATLAQLKARLDAVEAELQVRTDIMNVTSIVSEADKKGGGTVH